MTEKRKFSVERIEAIFAELDEFNSCDLKDIELTQNGETLQFSEEILEKWRFVGMSNGSFVDCRWWESTSE